MHWRVRRFLLSEAKLLVQHNATSGSAALAILSMEEAGKVVFLTLLSNPERQSLSRRSLQRFRTIFYSHDGKINLLTHPAWKSILYVRRRSRPREVDAYIRRLVQAWALLHSYLQDEGFNTFTKFKERCLYLDIDAHSALFLPQLPCLGELLAHSFF